MRSFLQRVWDTLVGAPSPPLNTVADMETVDEILNQLRTLQRQMATLQFEWAETLDKITVQASRFSARQKKRSQREMDAAMADGDELVDLHHPPALESTPTPQLPLSKMERIRLQIAEQRKARGA